MCERERERERAGIRQRTGVSGGPCLAHHEARRAGWRTALLTEHAGACGAQAHLGGEQRKYGYHLRNAYVEHHLRPHEDADVLSQRRILPKGARRRFVRPFSCPLIVQGVRRRFGPPIARRGRCAESLAMSEATERTDSECAGSATPQHRPAGNFQHPPREKTEITDLARRCGELYIELPPGCLPPYVRSSLTLTRR